MENPILREFRNLTRFSGRDRRGQFWPFAGIVFAIYFVMHLAAMAVFVAGEIAASESGRANPPDFQIMTYALVIEVVVVVGLLAAAVSRRLHDRALSAYWALVPLTLLSVGVASVVLIFESLSRDADPNMGLFGLMAVNNVFYMISLVTLIVFLALPGTKGPNRHGPAPQA